MDNDIIVSRWRVRTGIYVGHEFYGEEVIINGEERILDKETVGRSYPKEYCEQL
jgi:hypothetical protein